jgi:hypothetical protein
MSLDRDVEKVSGWLGISSKSPDAKRASEIAVDFTELSAKQVGALTFIKASEKMIQMHLDYDLPQLIKDTLKEANEIKDYEVRNAVKSYVISQEWRINYVLCNYVHERIRDN